MVELYDDKPRIAMTIEDIKKIIATDETRTLELKKSTGELNIRYVSGNL